MTSLQSPSSAFLRSSPALESMSGSDSIRFRNAFIDHGSTRPADVANRSAIPTPPSAVPREDGLLLMAAQSPAKSDAPTAPVLTPEHSNETLFARLTDLVQAAPVMLFMKGTPSSPRCRFSARLARILREHSIKSEFYNILTDEDVRQGLKEFADWPTFPQLWVDGQLVGGLDVIREEISAVHSQYSISEPVA